MTRSLTNFKALTFDCYGTLIDWESGIWTALQPLLDGTTIGRATALTAFGHAESALEAAHPRMPYPDILTGVHRSLASEFELATDPDLDAAFGASVPQWPAFPDSRESLGRLGTQFRLMILSNVHRSGFAASQHRLGTEFDAVYTAEDIGSYKPNPANFAYMVARLEEDFGLGGSDVLHVAQSMFHDHVPASAHGLATAWIDRQRLSEGGSWGATAKVTDRPTTDYTFLSLADMADAVGAEAANL